MANVFVCHVGLFCFMFSAVYLWVKVGQVGLGVSAFWLMLIKLCLQKLTNIMYTIGHFILCFYGFFLGCGRLRKSASVTC